MSEELASIFLRHSASKLLQMREHIHVCLNRLDDGQIWARGSGNENSIGNLVLHLCGNARQWIISGVGGEPDIRQRDHEFSATGGCAIDDLRKLLNQTIDETIAVIHRTSATRLTDQVTPQNYSVTVLEAIYQVVGHFQQHTGQIIFATKALTGADLGIYRASPIAALTNR